MRTEIKPINIQFDPKLSLEYFEIIEMKREISGDFFLPPVKRDKQVQDDLNNASKAIESIYKAVGQNKDGAIESLLQLARYSVALAHESIPRKKVEAVTTLSNWNVLPVNWDPTKNLNDRFSDIWQALQVGASKGIRKTNEDQTGRRQYINRYDELDAFVLKLYHHARSHGRWINQMIDLALRGKFSVDVPVLEEVSPGKFDWSKDSDLHRQDAVDFISKQFPNWMVKAGSLGDLRKATDLSKWHPCIMECLWSFSDDPLNFPVLRARVNRAESKASTLNKRRNYASKLIKEKLRKMVSCSKK